MEKRILGIALTIMGIVGLLLAAFKFINGKEGNRSVKEIIIYTILGVIFFVAGISLIRNIEDKSI